MAGGGGAATGTKLLGIFTRQAQKGKVNPELEAAVAELLLQKPEMLTDITNPLARELAARDAKKHAAQQALRLAPVSGAAGGRLATDQEIGPR